MVLRTNITAEHVDVIIEGLTKSANMYTKTSTIIRPKKCSRSVRRLKDFSEMTGLTIGLLAGFISGESFRLRPALSHVSIGCLIFMLGSSLFVVRLFGDGWLTRETLTRGINRAITRIIRERLNTLKANLTTLKRPGLFPGSIQAFSTIYRPS